MVGTLKGDTGSLTLFLFYFDRYWFALIKVLVVIVFVILGILVDTAVLGGVYYGMDVFKRGGVQSAGILSTFLTASFSFQGTELIGVAAGESENPRRNVPRAIKQVT